MRAFLNEHVASNMKSSLLLSAVLFLCGLSGIVMIPILFAFWKRSKKTRSKPDCVLFFPDNAQRNSSSSSNVSRLIGVLSSAQRSLDVCVYTISSQKLVSALIDAHQRSVTVRVITDGEQMSSAGSQIMQLRKAGIQVRHDASGYFMHHKFAIVDGTQVANGSLNWTQQGLYCNEENVVIINGMQIVQPFVNHFQKLWAKFSPDVLFSVDLTHGQ